MKDQAIKMKLSAAQAVVAKVMGGFRPQVGLVLGSGYGFFVDQIRNVKSLDYGDISHCPTSAVVGHSNKLCWGHVGNVPIVVAQGRVHYYEGYDMSEVVFPVRLMALLGAQDFILTHAVGSIRPEVGPGNFYLDIDHLSFNCPSPLHGPNVRGWGPRFPDMSEVYSEDLRELALDCAQKLGIVLHQGIAGFMPGPQYETPAEIRSLRKMGAAFATMSTVPEAIALRHMGRRVLAIAGVTNLASGLVKSSLDHTHVTKAAEEMRQPFVALLNAIVRRMLKV